MCRPCQLSVCWAFAERVHSNCRRSARGIQRWASIGKLHRQERKIGGDHGGGNALKLHQRNVFGCQEDLTKAQWSGNTGRKGQHRLGYFHEAYVRNFDNDLDLISQQNSKVRGLPDCITSIWSSHPFALPGMLERLRRNRSSWCHSFHWQNRLGLVGLLIIDCGLRSQYNRLTAGLNTRGGLNANWGLPRAPLYRETR